MVAALSSVVSPISSGVNPGSQLIPGVTAPQPEGGKASFQQILEKVQNISGADGQIHQQLQKFESKIVGGAPVAYAEMIGYQIKANNLHMRVELVSKLAESVLATAKKLQNGQ